MLVDLYSEIYKLLFECDNSAMLCVLRQNNASNVKSDRTKCVDKSQNLKVIGNTKITSCFIFIYCFRTYNDNYLRLILKLHKHLKLTVRLESRQNPRSVVIVE